MAKGVVFRLLMGDAGEPEAACRLILPSDFGSLSRVKVYALGVVLEVNKPITVVQLNLKLPQHRKPQKAGYLRPGTAADGGEVQRDDV